MNDDMQSTIAFLAVCAICALAAKIVAITEKKKYGKRAIKVGDCITPKHNWSSYDDGYTDIYAMASAVHKESRK